MLRSVFLPALAALLLANSAAAQAPGEVTRVACVGEHSTDSGRVENSLEYPARLQLLLGDGYQVAEFGFGTASLTTTGFPTTKYADSAEYAASLAFEPDIVIVGPWGRGDVVGTVHIDDGVNNNVYLYEQPTPLVTAEFQSALESLLTAYQELPSAPAVLVALPLPFPYGTGEGHMTDIVLPVTQELAAARTLPVIDLWAPFLGLRDEFEDADHLSPSPGGMEHLAQVVLSAVQAHESGMGSVGGSGGNGGAGGAAGIAGAGGMAGVSVVGGGVEMPAIGGGAGLAGSSAAAAAAGPSAGAGGTSSSSAASSGGSSSSSGCGVPPGARMPSASFACFLLAAVGIALRRRFPSALR